MRAATTSTNPPGSRFTVPIVPLEFCWSDDSYTECVTANTTPRDALYDDLREGTGLTANLVHEITRLNAAHMAGP